MRYTLVLSLMFALPYVSRAAIPGADNPKAYTEHDYRRTVLEFNRRTMSRMYNQVGKRSPKWDKQAVEFLDRLAEVFTYSPAAGQYRRTPDDAMASLEKLGKAAQDAGCDDPLVTYSYGVVLSALDRPAGQVRPLIQRGAAELYTSHYPINRASAAANREFKLTPAGEQAQREAAWQRYADLTISMIASWPYEGVDRRIILEQVWDALEEHGPQRKKEFVDTLALQGGADPWVSHVVRGRHEIELAWAKRGSGLAGTVTEAGWAAMRKHMASAKTHLEAAWKLEPTFPEPAVDLITVAMAGSDHADVEMRTWFERAVGAQLDYDKAYSTYAYALLPRWHGSHDAMYALGKECAATQRFDTRVPYQLVVVLELIAADEQGPAYWQRPGVYDDVKTVLEGMARNESVENHADFYRSYQAAIAWRANRFDEARRLLESLGERFQPEVFQWLNVMGELAISHAYAMAPPTLERVTLAEQQAAGNQFDAAVKTYQAALAALPDGHKGSYFLRGRAKQLQWQGQFVAGDWVDVQPDKDLAGWFVQRGKWEVDEAGGLVGRFTPEGGLMLFCQAGFLGKDFVIEGNVELADSFCDGGIGIAPGTPSAYYGLALRREKARTTLVRDLASVVHDDVELKPVNQLRFTFSGGTVSADLNGKRIFARTDIDYAFPNPKTKTYIGVGGRFGTKGAKVRFTSLRIKRATADGMAE